MFNVSGIKDKMSNNISRSYSAPFEAAKIKVVVDSQQAEAASLTTQAASFPSTAITELNKLALQYTLCVEPVNAGTEIANLERSLIELA